LGGAKAGLTPGSETPCYPEELRVGALVIENLKYYLFTLKTSGCINLAIEKVMVCHRLWMMFEGFTHPIYYTVAVINVISFVSQCRFVPLFQV
jgi:hypothetical protein